MAEPLSFAASIIAVVQAAQAAGQLLFAIYGYCEDVKRAPSDIRKLVAELESLKTVFKMMEDYGNKNIYSIAIQGLDNALKECTQELQEVYTKLSKAKRGWRKMLRSLKWPLQAKETMEILARIERHKSTFNLGLATENIATMRSVERRIQHVDLVVQGLQVKSTGHIALSKVIREHVQSTDLGVRELYDMSEDHVAISKNIEDHVQHIQEEQHAGLLSQDALRKEEEKVQAAKKRKRVLNWVFPGRCDKKHIDIRTRRRKGTGKWLWETPEVKKWIADPDAPILWGRGIPGAGKTFLSSALIDYVDDQVLGESDGAAHIYFDYKEQEQQKAVDILSSLIKQLASQTPHLPLELEDLHSKLEHKDKRPTLDELSTVLLAVFKCFNRVFLIFDALDECHQSNQRKDLIPLFHRMLMNGVNLFITSRPYPEDIQESFLEHSVTRLELIAKEEDITIYIEEKIDEDPRAKRLVRQAKCQQKIISELVDCAKGMFLLVHFHIEYICQQTTAKQILEALDKLKSSTTENRPLDPTYNRAMVNLRGQSKSCTALASNILLWLVKARRPMTVDEIRVAVSVQPDRYELDELDLPDNHTLLDVCAGLVMIDEHSNTIKLVHYTVQEYLLINDIIPSDADLKIAISSTTYFLFKVFAEPTISDEGALERLQLYPFLRYAVSYLSSHFQAHDDDAHLATSIIMKFVESAGNVASFLDICFSLKVFGTTLRPRAEWANEKLSEGDILSVACTIGHYATVKMLLERGADLSVLDDLGYTPLHIAAAGGHESIVQLLFDKGADLSIRSRAGWTALHNAASRGHHSMFKILLSKGADWSARTDNGSTTLHIAALKGHPSIVQLLLDNGADILSRTNDGWTPLHEAASAGHESTVQLLLNRGTDMSVINDEGEMALHRAVSGGHQPTVQLLLDNGADLAAQTNEGWTPLHKASLKGHQSIVKLLLDKNADLSIKANDGWTPLHEASSGGHEPTAKLLLDNGAYVTARTDKGLTPLHSSAAGGHYSVVQLLLDNGADLSIQSNDGWTALHEASSGGYESIVQLLLSRGADLSVKTIEGSTALHLAAQEGHQSIAKILLDHGADLSAKETEGWTPLHAAAQGGSQYIVQLLLDKGADLSARANDGWTVLHCAALKGHEYIIQLVLDKGADISVQSGDGWTPLHEAASGGHESTVQLLLARGIDPSVKENKGLTALHKAVSNGHESIVQLLLDRGPDSVLSIRDDAGNSPLKLAASRGHESIVQILLDKGADLAVQAVNGWTALHEAVFNGYEPIVQLLLDRGPDSILLIRDDIGNPPLILAASRGHESIVRILLDKGANPSAQEENGWTALHYAVSRGHEPITQLLLDRSLDLLVTQDNSGKTAMDLAQERKLNSILQLLFDRGNEPLGLSNMEAWGDWTM